MQKESSPAHDYGTNCLDCERYKRLGDVCLIEHEKKFLWEYCRDFVPQISLPDYKELMQTVKNEQALARQKAKEKKEREKKKRLKERLAKKEEQRKKRRARLRRIRERKKLLESKRMEKISKKKHGVLEPEVSQPQRKQKKNDGANHAKTSARVESTTKENPS